MQKKKYLIHIGVLLFGVGISLSAYGMDKYITLNFVDESKNISQGGLAVIFINSIGLESELPDAPILGDYIKILDKNGIRPLGGWVPRKMVTNGDFAVILARAMGLEGRIMPPQQICEEVKEYVQKMWALQYRRDGHRKHLEQFLQDKRFFPDGPPKTPFGYRFVDKDRDYVVDPIAILPGARELHPTIKYIYALRKRGVVLKGSATRILTLRTIKAAMRSPIFRSAPLNVYVHAYKEEAKEEARAAVTPVTE